MDISELKTKELEQACKEFQVKELYVFGSIVSDSLSEQSDIDFLVDFISSGFEGAFERYMSFKERLETIYQRPVDLIKLNNYRNPLFKEEVERTKELLYAAA